MRIAGILFYSLLLIFFADEQTSLYRRALEAESYGDIVSAVTLLEEALLTEGEYTEEILQILKQYYNVLGIEFIDAQKQRPWRFGLDFDAIGIRYTEKVNGLNSREWIGEAFSVLSLGYDWHRKQIKHSLEISFLSDLFWKSDSSSLDTNDWVLSPSIQYILMSKSFALSTGIDFTINEKDGFNPDVFFFFEKYAFKKGSRWFALDAFAFVNKILEMRYGFNLSWNQIQKKGLSISTSLGAQLNVDSTVFIQWIYDDNFFDGFDPPYLDVSYYQGVKWGPTLKVKTSYQFENPIGIEIKGRIAPSFLLNGKDSASVSFIEGGFGGYLFVKWDKIRVHVGVEEFLGYYLERPEIWKDYIPKTTLFTEFKIGTSIKF